MDFLLILIKKLAEFYSYSVTDILKYIIYSLIIMTFTSTESTKYPPHKRNFPTTFSLNQGEIMKTRSPQGFAIQGEIMKTRSPQGFAIGIHYSFLLVFVSVLSRL